jgi:hypothetical protein
MTAKQKIENLTNAWYGFELFAGAVGLVQGGLGFFSLIFAALSTLIGLVLTWVIGRKLLAGSSFTRIVLLVLSPLSLLAGAVVAWKGFGMLFDSFSLGLVLQLVLTVSGLWMNARSLRVLTDSSVRAHCS